MDRDTAITRALGAFWREIETLYHAQTYYPALSAETFNRLREAAATAVSERVDGTTPEAAPNQPREHSEVEALLAEHYVRKFARDTGRPESDYRGKIWVVWDGLAGAYDLRGESIPAHPDLVAQYPNGWSLLDYIAPAEAEAALQNTFTGERPNAKHITGPEPVRISVPGYPFTVGRSDCTGEVRYYATLDEAEARIAQIEETDPAGVHAGDYYVDGPDELINPKPPERVRIKAGVTPYGGRILPVTGREQYVNGRKVVRVRIPGKRHVDIREYNEADVEPVAEATPKNTFTAVENALAVMLLNHRIREYLELYDPKAFEQAESALAAHNPSFPAKLAEARRVEPQK